MNLSRRPIKQITVPVSGSVDISRVRSIIDHPRFQDLGERMQLGEAHVVYRGARHSRFEHSIGVGKWAWRRLRRWCNWGMISAEDVIDGETFGFLHDIGHGPRSHITDPLVSCDHETRAIAYLEEMASEIKASGADYVRIQNMMRREDPLATCVLHTPLGVDKLDYLERDAHHTGLEGMPEVGIFLDSVYYCDGKLVVDVMAYDQVKQLIQFYWTMYSRVYFRTAVLLSERYLQRMISVLLGQTGDDAAFSETELVEMTDSDLNYHLSHAANKQVRKEYAIYLRRGQARPAIVLQPEPFDRHNWGGGHPVCHLPTDESFLSSPNLSDPRVLYKIERQVEAEVGLPFHSVLAVAPVPARRFNPHTVYFQTDKGIVSLQELSDTLWRAQKEESRRYARFYIGVYQEHCSTLARPEVAKRVGEVIMAVARS